MLGRSEVQDNALMFRQLPPDHVEGDRVDAIEGDRTQFASLPSSGFAGDTGGQITDCQPRAVMQSANEFASNGICAPLLKEVPPFVQI